MILKKIQNYPQLSQIYPIFFSQLGTALKVLLPKLVNLRPIDFSRFGMFFCHVFIMISLYEFLI